MCRCWSLKSITDYNIVFTKKKSIMVVMPFTINGKILYTIKKSASEFPTLFTWELYMWEKEQYSYGSAGGTVLLHRKSLYPGSNLLYLYTSVMKWQFVLTHIICQTKSPPLLDSCVINIPSVKMCTQKYDCTYFIW